MLEVIRGGQAALLDIFLALTHFIQHVQPVHDLLHIGGIGQLVNGVQGILFGCLRGLVLPWPLMYGVRIANFKTDTAAYTNLYFNSTPLKYHHV